MADDATKQNDDAGKGRARPWTPAPIRRIVATAAEIALLLAVAVGAVLAVLMLIRGLPWTDADSDLDARRAAALVFAHIADPRIAADTGAAANHAVLTEAVRALRARPGVPAPQLLLLTGEVLVPASPSTAAGADQGAAQGAGAATQDTLQPPAAPPAAPQAGQVETQTAASIAPAALGRALAGSPATIVFVAAADTLPAAELASLRGAAGATMQVHDLAVCWAPAGTASEPCDAGARYRLVYVPRLPADSVAVARARIQAADSLVSAAEREDRAVILVPANLPATDSSAQAVADAWVSLTGRDAVAAVLVPRGPGARAGGAKFVRTPPMGAPPGSQSAATRGLSIVTLGTGGPVTETLLYDEAFRRIPAAVAAQDDDGVLAGVWARGTSLGEPGRTAVFWIAVLTAFLTVAALWKVPDAPAATPSTDADPSRQAGADDAAARTAAAETGVFNTNLGRTVLSGLTGIAAVTVLKDLWNMQGAAGQAWFVIVFILSFLVFLTMHAVVRGIIEALHDRIAMTSATLIVGGRRPPSVGRRFVRWVASYKVTALVFADTLLSVLFGQPPRQLRLWQARYNALQAGILLAIDRVREQISETLGTALREAGFADAVAERDYRVSISLLAADASKVFYISSSKGALSSEFVKKSVAYVAIVAGVARWWKVSYQSGHPCLRSQARLHGPGGRALAASDPIDANLEIMDASGNAKHPTDGKVTVTGKRGDGSAVAITDEPVGTVGELIWLLNGPGGFGGGNRPAVASIDAAGYLVLAGSTSDDRSALELTKLTIGGADVGAFTKVVTGNVVLFHNAPEVFEGAGEQMMLQEYFEPRGVLDYEAFIVIPVPFTARGLKSGDRRAGIHVSFSRPTHVNALWRGLDRVLCGPPGDDAVTPDYDAQRRVLNAGMLTDPGLQGVLTQAVRVLAELVQQLNDTWLVELRRR